MSPALFPEESMALGRVLPMRRREFATGRACARKALAALGIPPQPILIGAQREPLWPNGVVGTLTHCPGYCAAVVGSERQFAAVGVDAEPNVDLPEGVLAIISCEKERELIRTLQRRQEVKWDRLLFSAKESIYKAWFTITRSWLEHRDVLLSADALSGMFEGKILVANDVRKGTNLCRFEGRYLVRKGLILTAVCVGRAEIG